MNYFIFKGIDSRNFNNLIVNELPAIVKAAPKVETFEVDGRNGSLTVNTGAYASIVKSVQCTIKNLDNIDNIFKWLNGVGDVIFSNQPDRYFKAKIINNIPFERVVSTFRTFIIEFECNPESYFINSTKLVFTEQGSFLGSGTTESNPIVTVYGQGNITLYLNDTTITLKNVSDYITINSELYQCYKDETNAGKQMVGYFPTLNPGSNAIIWTGNVEKIEIEPKWVVV